MHETGKTNSIFINFYRSTHNINRVRIIPSTRNTRKNKIRLDFKTILSISPLIYNLIIKEIKICLNIRQSFRDNLLEWSTHVMYAEEVKNA